MNTEKTILETAAPAKKLSPLGQLIKEEPGMLSFLKEGDLVDAVLLEKSPRAAYFDLGKCGTGIVYGAEMMNAKGIVKKMKPGEKINAKVADTRNDDGYIELSLAGAHKQQSWQDIKEIKEKDEAISVKILGANSGGLIAAVKEVKSFIPVSQLSNEHYPRVDNSDKGKILDELRKLVGEELKVKILDMNSRTGKLILSEKEALQENIKELISKYEVGSVIEGIISGTADFGAFIRFADNPAIEGLIHISELDHRLIDNPKEVVKIDEAVKAKITEIKDGQISLSLKALKENPWDKASDSFGEGQEVSGSVYKFVPFGAYINLDHDLQGMVHVTEFGGAEEMKKQLEPGKEYKFVIDSIKPEEKRITLKLKK
jgi:ribosomal protein S1